MQRRERVLCVMVAALCGGAAALIGAPSAPQVEVPAAPRQDRDSTPIRRVAIDTEIDAAGMPAAPASEPGQRTHAMRAAVDLPAEVRVCWTPTARRLLAHSAKDEMERRGARVRACVESERGLRGRMARNDDHVALIAGQPDADEQAHGFVSRLLGHHVLVAIVHEHNPIGNLPRHFLSAAATGEAKQWQHIGGDTRGDMALASVQEDQFTDRGAASELLGVRLPVAHRLDSDDAVRDFVAGNENALGLCSLAAVQRAPAGVRILPIDGVQPSVANYVAGHYPFATPVRVLARDAKRCGWVSNAVATGALTLQ